MLDITRDMVPLRSKFEADGYVKLDALLSVDTVVALRTATTNRLRARRQTQAVRGVSLTAKPFLQTFNAWFDEPTVRDFVLAEELGAMMSVILNVPGVQLIHDQVLFKEPGDQRTLWHVDQTYWPVGNAPACTLWVPLHDISDDMGPVACALGSHARWRLPEPSNEALDLEEWDRRLATMLQAEDLDESTCSYKCGDVEIHDGRTVHSAGPNLSSQCRKVLVAHYVDASAIVQEPRTPEQQEHMRLFGWEGVAFGATLPESVAPRVGATCQ